MAADLTGHILLNSRMQVKLASRSFNPGHTFSLEITKNGSLGRKSTPNRKMLFLALANVQTTELSSSCCCSYRPSSQGKQNCRQTSLCGRALSSTGKHEQHTERPHLHRLVCSSHPHMYHVWVQPREADKMWTGWGATESSCISRQRGWANSPSYTTVPE